MKMCLQACTKYSNLLPHKFEWGKLLESIFFSKRHGGRKNKSVVEVAKALSQSKFYSAVALGSVFMMKIESYSNLLVEHEGYCLLFFSLFLINRFRQIKSAMCWFSFVLYFQRVPTAEYLRVKLEFFNFRWPVYAGYFTFPSS